MYMCNNIEYYQPPKTELREPTKEEKSLRQKMIKKYPESFVDKLGRGDWIKVPTIKLEVDKRKAEQRTENFFLGNHVQIDFAQKGNEDYLVLCCQMSGFMQVYRCCNRSTE